MSTMFATVGALVIKSVAASRDTVFVAASGGAFPMIAAVTQEITALALVVLAAVVVPVALGLRRVDRKLNALLDRAQRDIDPVMHHARAITDNVNAITMSVRSQVDRSTRRSRKRTSACSRHSEQLSSGSATSTRCSP